MDPVSFVASLTALIGVVTTTSKTIYNVGKKFQDAPKDIESLVEQLRTLEGLLKELDEQLREHQSNALPQETLQIVWKISLTQMGQDIKELCRVVSELEPLLKKRTPGSKVLLFIRETLSEKEIAKYQGKIGTHIVTLTSIQTVVCGRKLNQVSQNITLIGNQSKLNFQNVSSQLSRSTGQLSDENNAGFQMVSSQLTSAELSCEKRHQVILGRLNNQVHNSDFSLQKLDEVSQQQVRAVDIAEAGFQAVHSGLVNSLTSNQEGHNATHALLSQVGGHLQQILRDRVTFGSVRERAFSSFDCGRISNSSATTMEAPVFWKKRYSHYLPIGALQLDVSPRQESTSSKNSAPEDGMESKITATFVPPRWLSSLAIKYAIVVNYNSMGNYLCQSMNLNPITVNYNPNFIEAVMNCDVKGVQKSFREGLARPTDHIIDGLNLVPWTKRIAWRVPFCRLPLLAPEMLNFMVQDNLPGQEHCIRVMTEWQDQPEARNFPDYLYTYLQHGGQIFACNSSLVDLIFISAFGAFSNIDWIPKLLFRSTEPWSVDDLSSIEICLIGTLANVDIGFQHRLEKCLMSFRSPHISSRAPSTRSLFEHYFGSISIVNHFHSLSEGCRKRFLNMLCKKGSVPMIEFFIDNNIDINEGDAYHPNLLGIAAVAENMDVVQLLLNAGGNATSALACYIRERSNTNIRDTSVFRLLAENAEPTTLESDWDPLLKTLGSVGYSGVGEWNRRDAMEVAKIILARKLYFRERLFGGTPVFENSYVCEAIFYNLPIMLELLLQHGVQAEARISDLFDLSKRDDVDISKKDYRTFMLCTWLTFCVLVGRTSCVKILINHGASVIGLDGTGRSAIQIAKSYTFSPHPRVSLGSHRVSINQDKETLAVLEQALSSDVQDSEISECSKGPHCALEPCVESQTLQGTAISTIITPRQGNAFQKYYWDLCHNLRKIWYLPFSEALLIRFFYVLSYILFLAVELFAFATGRKRVSIPSRSLLSVGAVAFLALISGSSFFGSSSSYGTSSR